jgi:plasmid stabilization system protein ParE
MAVELIFAPEAEQDLHDAYAWYERQRAGLGEEFLSCVDACIHVICRAPGAQTQVYQSYRRALVRRFPYAIFFEAEDDKVIIHCIMHTARDPERWRQRLS